MKIKLRLQSEILMILNYKIKLSTFVIDNRYFDRNLDKIQTIHCKIMEMIDENAEN